MDYGCQRTRNYSDYVVFHFPAWIKLQSIDSKQWLPKMDLRIALDGLKHTFTAEGEFKNGSLFVDLNDQFREGLMRLLVSEEAIIEFGPKDERLTVLQKATTPNGKGDIVGFIDDVVPIISSALGGGSVQSMETEVMLRKCVQYKKDGRF
jgi:hypothetical protein